MSINSGFSVFERNSVSIFRVARCSGVSRDSRGIGGFGLVSMLALYSGLILSGKVMLTGRIFLSLRLYSVQIAAAYFFSSRLDII